MVVIVEQHSATISLYAKSRSILYKYDPRRSRLEVDPRKLTPPSNVYSAAVLFKVGSITTCGLKFGEQYCLNRSAYML